MRYIVGAGLLVAVVAMGCNREQPKPEVAPVDQVKPAPPMGSLSPVESSPGMRGGSTVSRGGMDDVETLGGSKAQVPVAAPVGPVPKGTKPYVIKEGDKGFFQIAREQLGNQSRWKEIQALNPGVDAKKLRIGQTIFIPEK